MRSLMVWIVGLLCSGAAIGGLIATIVAPTFIAWYTTPGGSTPAMCECVSLVRTTIDAFVRIQAWGAGLGAILVTPVGLLVRKTIAARGAKPVSAE